MDQIQDKSVQGLENSIVEKIEKRLSDREKTRNQILAIGTTIIGILSAGIVKILIDSAVVTSVDDKISKEITAIESLRRVLEIESVITRMEKNDSVSPQDAILAQNLIEQGSKSDSFRNDVSFLSLLERYIDLMFKLNRWTAIDDACAIYGKFCYADQGTAFTIITMNGRRLLSSTDVNDMILKKYYESFSESYDSLEDKFKGVAIAYKLIWTFKTDFSAGNTKTKDFIDPLSAIGEKERVGFCRGINKLKSEEEMARMPTPIERSISSTTNLFLLKVSKQVDAICLDKK